MSAPPERGVLPRWVFLRLLGVVHLVAFVSFWVQANGLVGPDGISPAEAYLKRASEVVAQRGEILGLKVPTIAWWFGADESSLAWMCGAGVACALLLVVGILPRLMVGLLWVLYLSIFSVAGIFLGYQWDILLLEVTLLALFYAPDGFWPRPDSEPAPSRIAVWMMRLLWFKLMFSSGVVKLGNPTWDGLTALDYHYWTQPLPHGAAWFAHNFSDSMRAACTSFTLFVELVVPFLVFFNPRRARLLVWAAVSAFVLFVVDGRLGVTTVAILVGLAALLDDRVLGRVVPGAVPDGPDGVASRGAAFWLTMALMVGIAATGNYGFFNLLTIVVGVTLLDDAALRRLVPSRWRADMDGTNPPAPWPARASVYAAALVLVSMSGMRMLDLVGRSTLQEARAAVEASEATATQRGLAMVDRARTPLLDFARPFASINGYGLFARMTTSRFELVVEGSRDGHAWKRYGFKYKPDDPKAAPPVVGVHMPRLDWQMWFAALQPRCGQRAWFLDFVERLLEGSDAVHGLLAHNPFPGEPPRLVRVRRERYTFTDAGARAATGRVWAVTDAGSYCPAFTLKRLRAARR